jgi:glycine/D-amino acid oxidase-like deaminating enzyme
MAHGGNEFDVIVVGAGMAGVSCAGTLVEKGLRPLLICETADVAWNIRPMVVDGNVGYPQHPCWNAAWGGGWWYGLARRLNVPLTFEFVPTIDYTIRGSGVVHKVPNVVSATSLAELVERLFPLPIDRVAFEKVLRVAMDIPYQELIRMGDVPIADWLDDQGADEVLQYFLLFCLANMCETTIEVIREYVSVFGAWGCFRLMLCGEAPLVVPNPDPRTGLVVPLANAVENMGGEIWRGRKASDVIIESDRAVGIALEDGTEVRAKAVVMATGTPRVPKLLKQMPSQVEAAVKLATSIDGEDVTVYTVLDEPVCTLRSLTGVANLDGSNAAFLFPMHQVPGDHTQPGKQYLVSQAFYTRDEFATLGRDGAVKELNELCEEMFPGFGAATGNFAVKSHKHHWLSPFLHGPKLPSTTSDLPGLWFAGDGSVPNESLGLEGACSTGVLRGRAIAESLKT